MEIPSLSVYLPDRLDFLVVFPAAFVFTFCVARFASWLRITKRWKTNYSRKAFHFSVFTAAFVIGVLAPIHRVAAYGAGAGAFMALLVVLQENRWVQPMYCALAREQDAPNGTYYLLAPFCATAVGGIVTGIVFPDYYQVGYLVAGWGDAMGEPVGVRFGRHKYHAVTLSSTKCTRSLEGSAAVLVTSFGAAAVALFYLDFTIVQVMVGAAGGAILATLIEAVSPHGWDNLTTQLGACLGIYALFNLL